MFNDITCLRLLLRSYESKDISEEVVDLNLLIIKLEMSELETRVGLISICRTQRRRVSDSVQFGTAFRWNDQRLNVKNNLEPKRGKESRNQPCLTFICTLVPNCLECQNASDKTQETRETCQKHANCYHV